MAVILHTTTAKVKNTTSATEHADNLYEIISACDSRYSHTSETTDITVDNTFIIRISNASQKRIGCTLLDSNENTLYTFSTDLGCGSYMGNNPNTVSPGNTADFPVAYISTTSLSYICIYGRVWTTIPLLVIGFYLKDNKHYFFYGVYNGDSGSTEPANNKNIENVPIYCYEDQTPCTLQKLANYNLPVDVVSFSKHSIITEPNGSFAEVRDFCSCSNLTYLNTYSIKDKNYYAVGTNTLIEVV